MRTMNVMIVDNDAAWTRSLDILLTQRGYAVTAFTVPEHACEFIERVCADSHVTGAELPDAVVLDYIMPRLNGLELLARIAHRLKPGCVVVLVTGHGDRLSDVDIEKAGVAACLEKPIDVDEVITVLEGAAS